MKDLSEVFQTTSVLKYATRNSTSQMLACIATLIEEGIKHCALHYRESC